jgi:hypothetical protein
MNGAAIAGAAPELVHVALVVSLGSPQRLTDEGLAWLSSTSWISRSPGST